MMGANIGANPVTRIIIDIKRAVSSLPNRSRIIARASTVPAQAPKACSARMTMRRSMLQATAHPALVIM